MKIHLHDFGCWESKTIEFEDTGINLLSGPSGSGKTTILRAIVFALYGVGKKVVRTGKSKCKVELWHRDLYVVRTKGPKRLIVRIGEHEYEDAEAQGVLNTRFGDISLSYLEQNGKNTFVGMSPQQKLEFIETLSFLNFDLGNTKERLKQRIKSEERHRLELDTQLSSCLEQMDYLNIPKEPEDKALLDIARKTGNPDEMIESRNTQIKEQYERILQLQSEIKSQNLLREKIVRMEQQLEQAKTLLRTYQDKCRDASDTIASIDTQTYRDIVDTYEKYTRLDELAQRIQEQQRLSDELLQDEQYTTQQRLDELNKKSFPYSRKEIKKLLKRARVDIQTRDELIKVQERIDQISIDEDVDQLEATLEALNQQITEYAMCKRPYQCPKCSATLGIVDSCLVCIQSTAFSKTKMDKLQRDYTNLKSKITSIRVLNNELDTLSARKQELTEKLDTSLRYSVDELEDMYEQATLHKQELASLTATLESIHERISRATKAIEPLRTEHKLVSRELETLERPTFEQRDEASRYLEQVSSAEHILKEYNPMIKTQEETIQTLTDEISISKNKYIDVDTLQLEADRLYTLNDTLRHQVNNLYQIKEYLEALAEHTRLSTLQQTLVRRIDEAKHMYQKCIEFKEMIAKAEGISIASSIDTLNMNAQIFLDAFFPDEPMSARIVPVKGKDSKKERRQINIELDYKGMSLETSMLSGGEYDRLSLAFMLGICNISKSPIVLLDECISSLDQENAENVCSYLRTHQSDRCSILIAHQVVSGVFDQVVETLE